MQTQASGYTPNKKAPGVKRGSGNSVRTGQKPKMTGNNLKRTTKRVNNQVRKTSRYSKNRPGVKKTVVGQTKSMALNNAFQNIQAQSNNPGLNFPIGPLL